MIAKILLLILLAAGLAEAGEPRTLAFLEEHHVDPGTQMTVGAVYIVPPGRKATISSIVCEIRTNNPPGQSQILLLAGAQGTITGPLTQTSGMNPIDCVNTGSVTVLMSGASFTLLPGNWIAAMYANIGSSSDFQMLSAFIFEEDLNP